MTVTVLRKTKYLNSWIYVLQFEYVFQYMFCFNTEIYQDRISFIPGLLARLLWRVGMIKTPFTDEQIEEGEKIVLSGALKTLDELNDPKKVWDREKEAKKIIKQRKSCVWQAREGKDDMFYMCLTHKQIVKMVDGEQPKHN